MGLGSGGYRTESVMRGQHYTRPSSSQPSGSYPKLCCLLTEAHVSVVSDHISALTLFVRRDEGRQARPVKNTAFAIPLVTLREPGLISSSLQKKMAG